MRVFVRDGVRFFNTKAFDVQFIRRKKSIHKFRIQRCHAIDIILQVMPSDEHYLRNSTQEKLLIKLIYCPSNLLLHVKRIVALDIKQAVQYVHAFQQMESTIEVTRLRHLQELNSNAFSRHFDREEVLDIRILRRLDDVWLDRAFVASGKTNRAEYTQRVFAECLKSGQRRANDSVVKIRDALHRVVLHHACVDVVEQTVDRQVTTVGIFQRSADRHRRNPNTLVILFFSKIHKIDPISLSMIRIVAVSRCFD